MIFKKLFERLSERRRFIVIDQFGKLRGFSSLEEKAIECAMSFSSITGYGCTVVDCFNGVVRLIPSRKEPTNQQGANSRRV